MKFTKEDALKYLCVKTGNGKVMQYRNPDSWEQYSEIAMQRLVGRMNGEFDEENYWTKMELLMYEYVDLMHNCLEIRINNIGVEAKAESSALTYVRALDLDSIHKKVNIKIMSEGDCIRIVSEYEELLYRYAAMLMCDLWDISNSLIVRGNQLTCNGFAHSIKKQKKKVIAISLDKLRNFKIYLNICGYIEEKNGVIPQPYRLDSVLESDVIHSLTSMELIYNPKTVNFGGDKVCTPYMLMRNIQQLMFVRGVSWSKLPVTSTMGAKEIFENILEYEKKQRAEKYPHRYFCFSDMDSVIYQRKLYCWSCGNSKIINLLADEIKQALELIIGNSLEWPLCGTMLVGKKAEEEMAVIHLLEMDALRWIVVGELNLSCV